MPILQEQKIGGIYRDVMYADFAGTKIGGGLEFSPKRIESQRHD
ncbi:MAG: hypothetical protein OEQ39_02650 [Gammaproteobacteria bacterium]|nr:hypothetical protein [Gammaproteobacteria bacterium]MDH3464947.1 hypothetical protein [Gammaproteobacteria bacterium]